MIVAPSTIAATWEMPFTFAKMTLHRSSMADSCDALIVSTPSRWTRPSAVRSAASSVTTSTTMVGNATTNMNAVFTSRQNGTLTAADDVPRTQSSATARLISPYVIVAATRYVRTTDFEVGAAPSSVVILWRS